MLSFAVEVNHIESPRIRTRAVFVLPAITLGLFATIGVVENVESFNTYVPAFAVNGPQTFARSSSVGLALNAGLDANPLTSINE
jgi:NADH:ubiquinone oxidoreductase subunit F (NADH-binding)